MGQIGEVVRLCGTLLAGLAAWTFYAFLQVLSSLRNLISGNEQPALAGPERDELLAWAHRLLPGLSLDDFGESWRDGVALRRLVECLVSAHGTPSDSAPVTPDQPIQNVNEAFRLAKEVLRQPPTLTVMDVISGQEEVRLTAYVTALREASERQAERGSLSSSPTSATERRPADVPAAKTAAAAAVDGEGLTAAQSGHTAQFAVHLPQSTRLDLLVEMRSEAGDYFSQRLTPRSPPRRGLEDEALAPAIGSARPKSNIPVGYQVTGRTVNLWYQPPAAGWLSLSVICGGQHVEGSPFRVYVGEDEETEGDEVKNKETEEVKEPEKRPVIEAVPVKEPVLEVVKEAGTEAPQSPVRRRPPLRVLSAVQEMSVDVIDPEPDAAQGKHRTPAGPVPGQTNTEREDDWEEDSAVVQEQPNSKIPAPSAPTKLNHPEPSDADQSPQKQDVNSLVFTSSETPSDQPKGTPSPDIGISYNNISPKTERHQDQLKVAESSGNEITNPAATPEQIADTHGSSESASPDPPPESASPDPPPESALPTSEAAEAAAALVAVVVTAAAAAVADDRGDSRRTGSPSNEHNEPNYPDGEHNEPIEARALVAKDRALERKKTQSQATDSPNDLPDNHQNERDTAIPDTENVESEKETPQNTEEGEASEDGMDHREPVIISVDVAPREEELFLTAPAIEETPTKKYEASENNNEKRKASKPSRKISWQERVVVAESIDRIDGDAGDEAEAEAFTPLTPVQEYTPSPPLYRRNTLEELVVVTDIPNSESKREVKIHQKRKLSRKESKFRQSRSRSSSEDPESPTVRDHIHEREHPLQSALEKEVSDSDKQMPEFAEVVPEVIKEVVSMQHEEKDQDSKESNIQKETAKDMKQEQGRKISFIERVNVIEVPIAKSEETAPEEKFDRRPQLVIQDSIDEPADWIHAPLSESKKELEVLGKVCEEGEEASDEHASLVTYEPVKETVDAAKEAISTETSTKPISGSLSSENSLASEEKPDDKIHPSHILDRSRLLQKNRILSMSTSSSETDEEQNAAVKEGRKRRSSRSSKSGGSTSSSDDQRDKVSKPESDAPAKDQQPVREQIKAKSRSTGSRSSTSSSDDDAAKKEVSHIKKSKVRSASSSGSSSSSDDSNADKKTPAKNQTESKSSTSSRSNSSSDENEVREDQLQRNRSVAMSKSSSSSGSSSSDSDVRKEASLRQNSKSVSKSNSSSSRGSSLSSDDESASRGKCDREWPTIEWPKAAPSSKGRNKKVKPVLSSSSSSSHHNSDSENGKTHRVETADGKEYVSPLDGENVENPKSTKLSESAVIPEMESQIREHCYDAAPSTLDKQLNEDKHPSSASERFTSTPLSDDERLEVKINVLTEQSSEQIHAKDEAHEQIEASIGISLGQPLPRSRWRSAVSVVRTQLRMNTDALPTCAQMRPKETQPASQEILRFSSSSDSENEKQQKLKQRSPSPETKTTKDDGPGEQRHDDKKKHDDNPPIDIDKYSDFDVMALVTSVVNESYRPSSTSPCETQNNQASAEKDQTDNEQEPTPTDEPLKVRARSSSSSDSSTSSDESDVDRVMKTTDHHKGNNTAAKQHQNHASSGSHSSAHEDETTPANKDVEAGKTEKEPGSIAALEEAIFRLDDRGLERTPSLPEERVSCEEAGIVETPQDCAKHDDGKKDKMATTIPSSEVPATSAGNDGEGSDGKRENKKSPSSEQAYDPYTKQDRTQSMTDKSSSSSDDSDVEKGKAQNMQANAYKRQENFYGDVKEKNDAEKESDYSNETGKDNAKSQVESEEPVEEEESGILTELVDLMLQQEEKNIEKVLVLPDIECETRVAREPAGKRGRSSESSSSSTSGSSSDEECSHHTKKSSVVKEERVALDEKCQKISTSESSSDSSASSNGEDRAHAEATQANELPTGSQSGQRQKGKLRSVTSSSSTSSDGSRSSDEECSPKPEETKEDRPGAQSGEGMAPCPKTVSEHQKRSSQSFSEPETKTEEQDACIADMLEIIPNQKIASPEKVVIVPEVECTVLVSCFEAEAVNADKENTRKEVHQEVMPAISTSSDSSSAEDAAEKVQKSKKRSESSASSDTDSQERRQQAKTVPAADAEPFNEHHRRKSLSTSGASSNSSSDMENEKEKGNLRHDDEVQVVPDPDRKSSSSSSGGSESTAKSEIRHQADQTPAPRNTTADSDSSAHHKGKSRSSSSKCSSSPDEAGKTEKGKVPSKERHRKQVKSTSSHRSSSASSDDKQQQKVQDTIEGRENKVRKHLKTSELSSSSHSSLSSDDDNCKDSEKLQAHDKQCTDISKADRPFLPLHIEGDIVKQDRKDESNNNNDNSTPSTPIVLQPHIASQFTVAEECLSSASEEEAQEVAICIDTVQPSETVERRSPIFPDEKTPASKKSDDVTYTPPALDRTLPEKLPDLVIVSKDENIFTEALPASEETKQYDLPGTENEDAADEMTKGTDQEPERTGALDSELQRTRQHKSASVQPNYLPTSVPKKETKSFEEPVLDFTQPSGSQTSTPTEETNQETVEPATVPTQASRKPSRKYSDQYSNFETPRDSRYRLQDMQPRSKSYLGQQKTRARPQHVMESFVLPCLVEVRSPPKMKSQASEDVGSTIECVEQGTALVPCDPEAQVICQLVVEQENTSPEVPPVPRDGAEGRQGHVSATDKHMSPFHSATSSSSSSSAESDRDQLSNLEEIAEKEQRKSPETKRRKKSKSSTTSKSSSSSNSDSENTQKKTPSKETKEATTRTTDIKNLPTTSDSTSSSNSEGRKHSSAGDKCNAALDRKLNSGSSHHSSSSEDTGEDDLTGRAKKDNAREGKVTKINKQKKRRSSSSSSKDSIAMEEACGGKENTTPASVEDKLKTPRSRRDSSSSFDSDASKSHRRKPKDAQTPHKEVAPNNEQTKKVTKSASSSDSSSNSDSECVKSMGEKTSGAKKEATSPKTDRRKSKSSTTGDSIFSSTDDENTTSHGKRQEAKQKRSSSDDDRDIAPKEDRKPSKSTSSSSSSSSSDSEPEMTPKEKAAGAKKETTKPPKRQMKKSKSSWSSNSSSSPNSESEMPKKEETPVQFKKEETVISKQHNIISRSNSSTSDGAEGEIQEVEKTNVHTVELVEVSRPVGSRSSSSSSSDSSEEAEPNRCEEVAPPVVNDVKTKLLETSSDSGSSDDKSFCDMRGAKDKQEEPLEHETGNSQSSNVQPDSPVVPLPVSEPPQHTPLAEEILEIIEQFPEAVPEPSDALRLSESVPKNDGDRSTENKTDDTALKKERPLIPEQETLDDWVIIPKPSEDTYAAPKEGKDEASQSHTAQNDLGDRQESKLERPDSSIKEEPHGQHVSEWVHMWDTAINAGLYPTPTADVSQRLQEMYPDSCPPESVDNTQSCAPEAVPTPEDPLADLCFAQPVKVINEEDEPTVRAEPVQLIEDDVFGDADEVKRSASSVEGAFEAILVNIEPEQPADGDWGKHEENALDFNQAEKEPIAKRVEDETHQASLCFIDTKPSSPTGDDRSPDGQQCPELLRPDDAFYEETLPVSVRMPTPAVWRRASVDRQVGKFNITCIIRPSEAQPHGSETRPSPPRSMDRKWLNLENYTIMQPPNSPEKARQETGEDDEIVGSKTTVYLAPRTPPNARQELVALRCVRNSDDENSLTYLPEMRDLTPEAGDNEDSSYWSDKVQVNSNSDEVKALSVQPEAPLADIKQIRLAYENESPTNFKELRKVTPPHNANLEERKQKLLGSSTDITCKAAPPVAVQGKVGRLRAMFEQMDAEASKAPGREDSLRSARRFKSMVNVAPPVAEAGAGMGDRLEEPTLKERSRSTAALHRTPPGTLGTELSVAPDSVKERSRSTAALLHPEETTRSSNVMNSEHRKERSRSTAGLNQRPSEAVGTEFSIAPGSLQERSRSTVGLHRSEEAARNENAVDSTPVKERSLSSVGLHHVQDDQRPAASPIRAALLDASQVSKRGEALAAASPTPHYPSPPTPSDYVTLDERTLSSHALDHLEGTERQAKLDAIRRYFEGLQDGDITTGDDVDMLDDALVPDPGYNRSLPRLDASASDPRPPLSSLFSGLETERERRLNRSASSPFICAEGDGSPASLLEQVRQLRRRASGGALSQASIATSLATSTSELARHRDDGIVVFGPGMFQGKVNAVNRFQILVPHPDQAPLKVRVYSQRTDASTRAELRDLHCNYHQVAYWVSQPGWYRLHVRLGGGARHVDLMTKVSH